MRVRALRTMLALGLTAGLLTAARGVQAQGLPKIPPGAWCSVLGAVTDSDTRVGPCKAWRNNKDDDCDGLDDGQEQCVLETNAPAFNFYSGGGDEEDHWPANVDWLLARSELWFSHSAATVSLPSGMTSCWHDRVASWGQLNQANLIATSHFKKTVSRYLGYRNWSQCTLTTTLARPTDSQWDPDEHYYLRVSDDVHAGSTNDADWKAYSHVYPNDVGGVDVQYWLVFAWNDGFGGTGTFGGNHEGDWEGLTVRRYATGQIAEVIMGEHGVQHRYPFSSVSWTNTHPHVWVAKGSHAMFPSEGMCDDVESDHGFWPFESPGCEGGYRKWRTWPNSYDGYGWRGGGLVNVGEIGRPLNGQNFINANILWGGGDGPRSISFFGAWKFTSVP